MNATPIERIALVTDFGAGIYVGQVMARLSGLPSGVPVIDLVHDLPPFRPDLAAYLLPALVRDLPRGTLYLCVVDPGVGGERAGLVLAAGDDLFIGPDNGLLSQVARRCKGARPRRIDWQPPWTSNSFHGRDWFAPVAAALCRGEAMLLTDLDAGALVGADWADDLPVVVYVDTYGNLMCGLRPPADPPGAQLRAAGRTLAYARTFCEVPPGQPFWYENALGLVEIAVNQGRADRVLGLAPGDPVQFHSG
ncbi:SAM-dependent chlorinase/fluorinase [uncultured Thiodictyon sp.]|jgi:S-adenosylmethionine hydrolase|uniref:SAM hydrolase/SAM-dependent halogenase family protein n=1 Tax=uncultured Thiodictyon sp. TaxID=1846217 RepID=UPI0025E169B7|nr:SAM-dependent chlorinase/fluorinase [uncultured Thiodictyon sp.]